MRNKIAEELGEVLLEVADIIEAATRTKRPTKTTRKRAPAKKKTTTRKKTTRKRTPAKKKTTTRKKTTRKTTAPKKEPKPKKTTRKKTKVKREDLSDVARTIVKGHKGAELFYSSRGEYTIRFNNPMFELTIRPDSQDKLEVVGTAPLKMKGLIKSVLSGYNPSSVPEYIPEGRSKW